MLITRVATNATKHRTCDFQVRLSACVDDIAAWMLANRLQLNTGKTELLWCATSRRQQLPTSALRIGSDLVSPSSSVRDLGIYVDDDLSMRCQVKKTVANCFAVLRQLHAQYQMISSDARVPDARCRPRLVTAGLRQCCTVCWWAYQPT